MAKISINNITSKKEWEDFLLSRPEANFLQSWSWGEFYEAMGNKIQRTGFYANGKLIGIMLSIVENAKRGKYLIVPAGPIINWGNETLVNCFFEEVKKIASFENCVFVRIRPQLTSDEFSKKLFAKHKFINASMHLHAELTSQLDITKNEEELLKNMRKATRYEIKKAILQKIKIIKINDPTNIKKFYDLQLLTAKRQNFTPFSYKYLHEQFKIFAREGKALLYSAEYEGKLLAQAFIIFYGQEAVYHYGVSTKEGRKYPGAYLIQWEAINEAKKRGMKKYNFWGVAPLNKPKHRFYGVSIFKRGFGGEDFEYLHAQDLVIKRLKYFLNYLVESTRKKIRSV